VDRVEPGIPENTRLVVAQIKEAVTIPNEANAPFRMVIHEGLIVKYTVTAPKLIEA
jgi:hypothetical protein